MAPWEKALRWYAKYLPDRNFGEDMALCVKDGVLWSHSELFVMAKEVFWDGERVLAGRPNAWFVHMAATSGGRHPILQVMDLAPYPLEWCLWQRRNDGRMRAHKWHDLITKLQGGY